MVMSAPARMIEFASVVTLSPTRSRIEPAGAQMSPCETTSGAFSKKRTTPLGSRFRSSPVAALSRTVKRIDGWLKKPPIAPRNV